MIIKNFKKKLSVKGFWAIFVELYHLETYELNLKATKHNRHKDKRDHFELPYLFNSLN